MGRKRKYQTEEEARAAQRAQVADWYKRHRQRARELAKRWRNKNPEYYREYYLKKQGANPLRHWRRAWKQVAKGIAGEKLQDESSRAWRQVTVAVAQVARGCRCWSTVLSGITAKQRWTKAHYWARRVVPACREASLSRRRIILSLEIDRALWRAQYRPAIETEKRRRRNREHERSRLKHPLRHSLRRAARNAKRRLGKGGKLTSVLLIIWNRQKGRCAYCRAKGKLELDHMLPLALGGNNDPANLQFLCTPCNWTKGAKRPNEYLREVGFLI